ncbi:hypothetical protein GQ457_07G006630 [Hibiscus cannabinus]
MSSTRGVIRGPLGEWLFGFARSIGSCSDVTVELWDAFGALSHAWRLGFCKVILELDNCIVVKILQGISTTFNGNVIMFWITKLLHRQWEVRISHVYCEANGVADGLASLVRGAPLGLWFYDSSPAEVVARADAPLM